MISDIGGHELSKSTGNAGARVGCGVFFTIVAFGCCSQFFFFNLFIEVSSRPRQIVNFVFLFFFCPQTLA